jgi:hypothetical protein
VIPANGRFINLGESKAASFIGIFDVGEVIVEVMEGLFPPWSSSARPWLRMDAPELSFQSFQSFKAWFLFWIATENWNGNGKWNWE